jgi:hypothetical protein
VKGEGKEPFKARYYASLKKLGRENRTGGYRGYPVFVNFSNNERVPSSDKLRQIAAAKAQRTACG